MEGKVCRACGETKALGAFYKKNNLAGGYSGACKQCRNNRATVKCLTCDSSFVCGEGASIYCSRACLARKQKDRASARLSMCECAHCGAQFQHRPRPDRPRYFCSRSCSAKAHWGERGSEVLASNLSAKESKRKRSLAMLLQDGLKECSHCRRTKARDSFCKNARSFDGLNSWCRKCSSDSGKRDYRKFRDRRLAAFRRRMRLPSARVASARRARAWRSRNPHYAARQEARRRALLKAAPGSFCRIDVVRLWHKQVGECARCGASFGKRHSDKGFHVDHIIPLSRTEMGNAASNYPRNLQLLCQSCNSRKHNKLPAEYTLYLYRITGERRKIAGPLAPLP